MDYNHGSLNLGERNTYWVILLPQEPLIGKLVRGEDGRFYLVLGDRAVPVEGVTSAEPVLRISVDEGALRRFQEWLSSPQRRRPARDPETIKKYISYLRRFHECSGGIISPETIMRCVSNKHMVRALRAYVEMMRFYGEVPSQLAAEILERLKWSEKTSLAEDEVPLSNVIGSIRHCLEKCREDYRLLYLAMLYSGGVRLEQLLALLPLSERYWLPRGRRPRPYGRYNASRALEDKGVESKPIDWVWLPVDIYEALKRIEAPTPAAARKYYSKHKVVTPTMLRSFCWQAGKYVIADKDLVRLMQGRLGELKRSVTARSYDALRYQLDELYPKWLVFVDKLVEAARKMDPIAAARMLIEEYRLPLPV